MAEEIVLKVTEGNIAGKQYVLKEYGSYLVGRSANCAVQIPKGSDGKVSRNHFVLTFAPQEIKIRDMGSRNGTLVNGEYIATGELFEPPDKIEPFDKTLQDGDQISIGKTVITLSVINVPTPPGSEKPAMPALSDLETITIDKNDLDDIDIDSLVQQNLYKDKKRTTKFTIKAPE